MRDEGDRSEGQLCEKNCISGGVYCGSDDLQLYRNTHSVFLWSSRHEVRFNQFCDSFCLVHGWNAGCGCCFRYPCFLVFTFYNRHLKTFFHYLSLYLLYHIITDLSITNRYRYTYFIKKFRMNFSSGTPF